MVCGREAATWMRIYDHTHHDTVRCEWPDGGSFLSQEYVMIEVWELITDEIRKYRNEQRH